MSAIELDTDPEDREPPEEWDDVCRMDVRQALSSPGHQHALPDPAITAEPSNTQELSNISPGRMYETLWSARAIQNVDNDFQLVEAAMPPSVRRSGTAYMPGAIMMNPVAVQQARDEHHGSMADLMEEQGSPQPRRSTGSPIPEILDRSSGPLCAQSQAEIARTGLRDAREEFRHNADCEESNSDSTEPLSDNASEHRPAKRRRTQF
ncbi:hypothetical protein NW768_008672 [Fusarium equiseti]|uniref:Uncharacterized protein n=1 Tax=Fusarium equiseti TaxID=61235 RepID=A0ABQ8R4Z9_FUSEQ|nr:hypothetical protein NW768_008672 [Fusarium equiseti]